MRCSCVSCLQRRGFNQPERQFIVVPGGGGGIGGISQAKTPQQAFPDRGLNKEGRLAKERLTKVLDDRIVALNPPFPYRVLQPDFEYFGVGGEPPQVG
jgi:hypothetical protein